MPFLETINFLYIFSSQTVFSEHLWMEPISKCIADSRRSKKMIKGFSQFLWKYSSRLYKSTRSHFGPSQRWRAEITRRAALRRSSGRVLSHHSEDNKTMEAYCLFFAKCALDLSNGQKNSKRLNLRWSAHLFSMRLRLVRSHRISRHRLDLQTRSDSIWGNVHKPSWTVQNFVEIDVYKENEGGFLQFVWKFWSTLSKLHFMPFSGNIIFWTFFRLKQRSRNTL